MPSGISTISQRQVFGLSFLNLIFSRTDIFVLGKLYSDTALGLYTMAVYLVQTPSIFLTNMLVQTLFPTFAHVQEDKERVNRILIEVTSWLILSGASCRGWLFTCAGPRFLGSSMGRDMTRPPDRWQSPPLWCS